MNRAIDLLPNNSRRVDKAWNAMLQDMALEVDQAFREHLAHHEMKEPGYAERVAAAMG